MWSNELLKVHLFEESRIMFLSVNRTVRSEFINCFIRVEKCIAIPLVCIGSTEMWKLSNVDVVVDATP